jgi:micrococcal nuclease
MASSPRTTSPRSNRARAIALVVACGLAALALLLASRYVLNTITSSDLVGGGPTPTMGADYSLDTTVVRVVDGDTLVARAEGRAERVRLIGVDTPETVSPSKPVQCYGKQASNHLKKLLPPGTAITLVTDADTHDRYGRLLAYVYRHPDGMFVNLELAQDGYASLLTFPPNVAHEPQFARAVDAAHQRRLGLWGTCGGPGVPLADAPSTTVGERASGG